MRYTFTDLVRRANVDAVVRRALTCHVTERMQRHYSHVGNDEKRAALAGVLRLVPPASTLSHRCQWDFGGGPAAQNVPISAKAAWLRERGGRIYWSGTRGSNPRLSAWELTPYASSCP
jgi:hypothetical protein